MDHHVGDAEDDTPPRLLIDDLSEVSNELREKAEKDEGEDSPILLNDDLAATAALQSRDGGNGRIHPAVGLQEAHEAALTRIANLEEELRRRDLDRAEQQRRHEDSRIKIETLSATLLSLKKRVESSGKPTVRQMNNKTTSSSVHTQTDAELDRIAMWEERFTLQCSLTEEHEQAALRWRDTAARLTSEKDQLMSEQTRAKEAYQELLRKVQRMQGCMSLPMDQSLALMRDTQLRDAVMEAWHTLDVHDVDGLSLRDAAQIVSAMMATDVECCNQFMIYRRQLAISSDDTQRKVFDAADRHSSSPPRKQSLPQQQQRVDGVRRLTMDASDGNPSLLEELARSSVAGGGSIARGVAASAADATRTTNNTDVEEDVKAIEMRLSILRSAQARASDGRLPSPLLLGINAEIHELEQRLQRLAVTLAASMKIAHHRHHQAVASPPRRAGGHVGSALNEAQFASEYSPEPRRLTEESDAHRESSPMWSKFEMR